MVFPCGSHRYPMISFLNCLYRSRAGRICPLWRSPWSTWRSASRHKVHYLRGEDDAHALHASARTGQTTAKSAHASGRAFVRVAVRVAAVDGRVEKKNDCDGEFPDKPAQAVPLESARQRPENQKGKPGRPFAGPRGRVEKKGQRGRPNARNGDGDGELNINPPTPCDGGNSPFCPRRA